MKTTTFYIENNSNNRNNFRSSTTNYSKMLDAIITSNVKAKNPYLFNDYEDYKPKKKIDIDITFTKPKKSCNSCPLKGICNKNYDLSTFTDAIAYFLNDYTDKRDNYDFKLYDGTPVKFFGNGFVQIGYDIYSLSDYSNFYNMIGENNRKSIIDIYIDLK